MISIESPFRSASSEKDCWDRKAVRRTLSALGDQIPDSQVEWEVGDENWGRVLRHGDAVAILSASVPVLVVLSIFKGAAESVAENERCQLVLAESFSEQIFEIDKVLLEQIVGRPLSSNVDYRCLSIDDLWWATV